MTTSADLVACAVEIVVAYVSHNEMEAEEVPILLQDVFEALSHLSDAPEDEPSPLGSRADKPG